MQDLTGITYHLGRGPYAGEVATVVGRDNLFPERYGYDVNTWLNPNEDVQDRWLVRTDTMHLWSCSGASIREHLAAKGSVK